MSLLPAEMLAKISAEISAKIPVKISKRRSTTPSVSIAAIAPGANFPGAKILCSGILGALGVGFLNLATVAQEEAAPLEDATGLCQLGDLSGRWVEGASGRMMPLQEICGRSLNGELRTPNPSTPDPSTDTHFWRAFLTAAGEEAIAFSEALPVEAIITYGTTICPLLEDGYTLQEVRTLQAKSDLPAGFDAAVNVAAIHTYCPHHAIQIGR